MERGFHHAKLPNFTTILSGHSPPDEVGFRSGKLQILYNHTDEPWRDEGLHAHLESDECFIVLEGEITVALERSTHIIRTGEFCCFPVGLYHAVTAVKPPVKALMIRAPSVQDKVYKS